MTTFLAGIVILIVGAALYGKFCEKVFGPDDRKTPAYEKSDGVDYVPMSKWKNTLANLLNIAGTGPIFGPIQGILFGPIAFITIPIGCVLGGAMHDYFVGMMSMRNGGIQTPALVRKYSNNKIAVVYRAIIYFMLFLIAAVFIYTPGDIILTQLFNFSGAASDPWTWVVYGSIFAYYIIATIFPVDKIMGKLYPVLGGLLMLSTIGVFAGVFLHQYPLTELFGNWQSPLAFTLVDGASVPFSYKEYFTAQHFIPTFFITVACGILSGFHSSQLSIVSRTAQSERHGRKIFYNTMVMEGFIAMIWAAAAMGVYNMGIQSADPNLATETIGTICTDIFGKYGAVAAMIGIVVLPITSGDTALRSLRLSIAEMLHIDQASIKNRLMLSCVLFVFVFVILVFSIINANGFSLLWRYFSWFNQSLSIFTFFSITVWLYENGKKRFACMSVIPGVFYTFVTVTYIMNARIGLNLPWLAAYIIGAAAAAAYLLYLLRFADKRSRSSMK